MYEILWLNHKLLYTETDASGFGPGAALLWTRSNTSCPLDRAPAKAWVAQKKIQQHRQRSTRHTIWTHEIAPLLLSDRGDYHYRSQATSCNIHKKTLQCCHKDCNKFYWEYITTEARGIYKPVPDLFIVDCLSRQNHKDNKDAEIPGMQININGIQTTTNTPQCMTLHELQQVISQDEHL